MDIKLLERMMVAMGRHRIKRLAIKEEGVELELEMESSFAPEMISSAPPSFEPSHTLPPAPLPPRKEAVAAQEVKEGRFITSPMVGTFYGSPSPDSPPFIRLGDSVQETSVVCIIEAMKVMNEVKAQLSGTVVEQLIQNGEPVEFGTKLYRVT